MASIEFKKATLPNGSANFVPADIDLRFPENSSLPKGRQNSLAFLVWSNKYLNLVPAEYRDFFKYVLPYLHVRTTDVHTAICLPLLGQLLESTPSHINRNFTYIGLILHDCGWSLLSDKEIADSLSYSGLTLSTTAKAPKNKHAQLGSKLAKQILNEFSFDPPLKSQEKKEIIDIVLHHDVTPDLIDRGKVTPELFLVSDADRLWSYTHENFWQDTIRKDVKPQKYIANLSNELDGYFFTPGGKALAKKLLQDRRDEVAQYPA